MTDEAAPLAIPTSVKERRKRRGLTQAELAHAVGLSTTAIHNLEAGKNGFTDKTLAALAAALECHPADLLMPISTKQEKIRTEPEILAFLARIDGLNEKDITVVFAVIQNALQANRGGSERSGSDDPQPVSNSHRVKVP